MLGDRVFRRELIQTAGDDFHLGEALLVGDADHAVAADARGGRGRRAVPRRAVELHDRDRAEATAEPGDLLDLVGDLGRVIDIDAALAGGATRRLDLPGHRILKSVTQ